METQRKPQERLTLLVQNFQLLLLSQSPRSMIRRSHVQVQRDWTRHRPSTLDGLSAPDLTEGQTGTRRSLVRLSRTDRRCGRTVAKGRARSARGEVHGSWTGVLREGDAEGRPIVALCERDARGSISVPVRSSSEVVSGSNGGRRRVVLSVDASTSKVGRVRVERQDGRSTVGRLAHVGLQRAGRRLSPFGGNAAHALVCKEDAGCRWSARASQVFIREQR